jgi:hypothetical protein
LPKPPVRSDNDVRCCLTLTDLRTGWTELAALWGNSGSEVRVGLEDIEKRMPFDLLGLDYDNGREFLNTVLEQYLLTRATPVKWTRSRPYKKNDQAHVEQKNFAHVRQLLGYGRYDDLELKALVDGLYANAWLPPRNYFTPVMKLVGKTREGSKVKKKYDTPKTPCDRLLSCPKVTETKKTELRKIRRALDPINLARAIEEKPAEIFKRVERIETKREQMRIWAGEDQPEAQTLLTADLRGAEPLKSSQSLAKSKEKEEKSTKSRVSRILSQRPNRLGVIFHWLNTKSPFPLNLLILCVFHQNRIHGMSLLKNIRDHDQRGSRLHITFAPKQFHRRRDRLTWCFLKGDFE